MSRRRLSRRKLLADLGLGAAMLPLLDAGRSARAAPLFPKRLFVLVWTNGALINNFWPKEYSKTDETVFSLSEVLAPLEPHKKDIVLIGGMDLRVAMDDKAGCPGRLHHSFPHVLTGTKAAIRPGVTGALDEIARNGASGGSVSVDQFVADALMKRSPTPIRSLELGFFKNTRYYNCRAVSFRGPPQNGVPQWNQPDIDPFKVYARVFGAGLPTDSAAAAERLARIRRERKSIMDFVGRDLTALGARLGTEDRQKIEQHATSLRQVEQELDALSASAASGKCLPPAMPEPARFAISDPANQPAVSKLQIDLAVAAMACNVTRVATFAMGDGGNDDLTFPWLGADFLGKGDEYPVRSHHDIAHRAYQDADHTRRKTLVDRWHMSQFAYVLERMKQIPEGSGTMLDNSLVAILNTGSEGYNHQMDRLPWVIGGRAGGYFKTGRYVKLGDWGQTTFNRGTRQQPHNGLLVAMANALDAPTQTFGDPAYGGEPSGLRG